MWPIRLVPSKARTGGPCSYFRIIAGRPGDLIAIVNHKPFGDALRLYRTAQPQPWCSLPVAITRIVPVVAHTFPINVLVFLEAETRNTGDFSRQTPSKAFNKATIVLDYAGMEAKM